MLVKKCQELSMIVILCLLINARLEALNKQENTIWWWPKAFEYVWQLIAILTNFIMYVYWRYLLNTFCSTSQFTVVPLLVACITVVSTVTSSVKDYIAENSLWVRIIKMHNTYSMYKYCCNFVNLVAVHKMLHSLAPSWYQLLWPMFSLWWSISLLLYTQQWALSTPLRPRHGGP